MQTRIISFRDSIILIISLIILSFLFSLNSTKEEKKEVRENTLYSEFVFSIKKLGGESAYALFKEEYRNVHFGLRHSALHTFGEALYEEEGVSGISVCDAEFEFGCYHGFFIGAILDLGVEGIGELDKACLLGKGPQNGCSHGIGHGVLEYFGGNRLDEALEACKRTTLGEDRIGGCPSGVFMEYNVPIIEFPEKGTIETFARKYTGDPFYPCGEIKDEWKPSCYHALPQWWLQVLGREFAPIGKLCEQIVEFPHRRACFHGIGIVASPTAEYDVEKTLSLCGEMNTEEGNIICRVGALTAFVGARGTNEESILCKGIEENTIEPCKAF